MVAARNMEEDTINLVQAISLPMKMVKIMAAVGNVAKAGKNTFQNYAFMQSDDVLDAVRAEMVKNNVVIIPRMIGYEQTAESKGFHAVVQFEFTLIDADSGETLSATWYGEASDSGDKGFSKAGTSALKYWLLKTFLISAGEPDADKDSHEHEHDEKSAQAKLRGNGQQDRRIPPKSNEKAANSNAAHSQAKTPQTPQNGAANPDSWDKTDIEMFVEHYKGKLTIEQLLQELNVTRFGEWTEGRQAAYKVADGKLSLASMEF